MDDFVDRLGKNVDVVLGTIAVTLASPPFAILAALLSYLYSTNTRDKPAIGSPNSDYHKLRDLVHGAITRHNLYIRNALITNGLRANDADAFLYRVIYDGYIDSLVKYAQE